MKYFESKDDMNNRIKNYKQLEEVDKRAMKEDLKKEKMQAKINEMCAKTGLSEKELYDLLCEEDGE